MESEAIWEAVKRKHPEANFLQSPTWMRANALMGHQPVAIFNTPEIWCNGIIKNAKRGRYLEIPGGPLTDWQRANELVEKIRLVAKENKCVFVRMRPQLINTPENLALLVGLGFKKAPMHLHAEHTVMIDLNKSEETLLAEMRKQTRYEVRQAEKQGIKVWHGNSENLFKEFHAVQLETAKRQNFVPPTLKTLLAEREAFSDKARIYVADTADGERICYGLMLTEGKEAEYFEAASTPLGRSLPGAYGMLWRAMRDFKQEGIERFNLWGIAPAGVKNHRYAGVTVFKKGFGGEVVEFVPAMDLILRPCRYQMDVLVEKIRKKVRNL